MVLGATIVRWLVGWIVSIICCLNLMFAFDFVSGNVLESWFYVWISMLEIGAFHLWRESILKVLVTFRISTLCCSDTFFGWLQMTFFFFVTNIVVRMIGKWCANQFSWMAYGGKRFDGIVSNELFDRGRDRMSSGWMFALENLGVSHQSILVVWGRCVHSS